MSGAGSTARVRRVITTPIVVTLALVGAVVSYAPVGGAATSAATSHSEAAAVRAVKWTSNVSVHVAKGSWTFRSTGLPASTFVAKEYAVPLNAFAVSALGARIVASASVLRDQNYDYTLPVTPVYSTRVTTTSQGPIGFLLDGAALYNPYEANHATVATADNFVASAHGVTASFLDSCDGHPGPGGQYHYHGLPTCLVAYATGTRVTVSAVTSLRATTTSAVSETNAASKKPVILGFAFDGYGIYDNVAMNGKTVPVSSLDACNGIYSPVPGYPRGVYHYVLENVKGARSSIGCYHGVVSSAYTHALEAQLGVSSYAPSPTSSTRRGGSATAFTLAARRSEDDLLRAMVRARGLGGDC